MTHPPEPSALYLHICRAQPGDRRPVEAFVQTQPLGELARALWPQEPRPVSMLAHAARIKGPGDTRARLEQFSQDEQRRMRERAAHLIYRQA